ncbi:MAG: GNAT family N-acetyltransferase [Pyrinomonadaceae bacterium]
MNRIEIKRAKTCDAEAIAFILAEVFAAYESLYTAKAFAATTPPGDVIKARFAVGQTWLALLNCETVGTVSAVPRGTDLYIRSMAILPKARGAKIGERMLEVIENYAIENDYKRLTLSTTPFLNRAIRLYENFGFTPCGAGELFGTPLITMNKELQNSGEAVSIDNNEISRSNYSTQNGE